MYTLFKFHFLNGISEINQLFDDILIIWPAPVYEVASNLAVLLKGFSSSSTLLIYMFFSCQLVKCCNDGARRMERTEQMYTIQKQMEFGKIKVHV